jgi:hypothetical protein
MVPLHHRVARVTVVSVRIKAKQASITPVGKSKQSLVGQILAGITNKYDLRLKTAPTIDGIGDAIAGGSHGIILMTYALTFFRLS